MDVASTAQPAEAVVVVGGAARHTMGPYSRDGADCTGHVENGNRLCRLPADTVAEMVQDTVWAPLSMYLYRTLKYFGASFRGWIGVCEL